jgi:hypothetical protein
MEHAVRGGVQRGLLEALLETLNKALKLYWYPTLIYYEGSMSTKLHMKPYMNACTKLCMKLLPRSELATQLGGVQGVSLLRFDMEALHGALHRALHEALYEVLREALYRALCEAMYFRRKAVKL